MFNDDNTYLLTKVIEATRLVASSADIQIAGLPHYANVPDEIALIFEDAFCAVERLYKLGLLSDYQKKALVELNSQFDKIENWTTDSLRTADEWNSLRRSAKDVLTTLGEDQTTPPNLFWLRFISEDS